MILKALSVSIERVGTHLLVSGAIVRAVSSARLIVCRSGCELISICVVVYKIGFIIDAPSVELPVTWDPSVQMKLVGHHVT